MTPLLTLRRWRRKYSMTDIKPSVSMLFNMGGSQIWLEPGEHH